MSPLLSVMVNTQGYLLHAPPDDGDRRLTADAARGGFVDLEQSGADACQGHITAGHAPGAEVLVEADGAEDWEILAHNAQVLYGGGVSVRDGVALFACRQAKYGEALVVTSRYDGVP